MAIFQKANSLEKIKKRTKYDLVKQTKKENFTFLNQTVAQNWQTVLVGDSITEIYNYGDLFFNYTKKTGQAVYNRGISGDTSDRLLERWEDNVLSIEPRDIVLLIGTNDLGVGAPIDFTINNIKEIIEITLSKCPYSKLIVESVYPVCKSIDRYMVGRRRNEDIGKLNKQLEMLCGQYEITWLDMTEALATKSGLLKEDFTYDGLHLNAKGFAVVTERLLPCLEP